MSLNDYNLENHEFSMLSSEYRIKKNFLLHSSLEDNENEFFNVGKTQLSTSAYYPYQTYSKTTK